MLDVPEVIGDEFDKNPGTLRISIGIETLQTA
jgi:hypothetical protein